MAVRLDHNFPPAVSYRALALDEPSRLPSPSGGDGGGGTPVPIPNTAVKAPRAHGTAWSACGGGGRRPIIRWRVRARPRGGVPLFFGATPSAGRDVRHLDADPVAQRTQLLGHLDDRIPPLQHRLTPAGQLRLIAVFEARGDRGVSVEQGAPRFDVGGVDAADVCR